MKFKKKKSGFTLIEVLVSLLILGIVMIPVLSMVLTTVRANKMSEDKQKAIYAAQKYIEQIKADNIVETGKEILKHTSNEDIPEGFSLEINKTPKNQFKFKDMGSKDEKKSFDIECNTNIEVYKNENNLIFYIRGSLKPPKMGNEMEQNTIKIVNEKKEVNITINNNEPEEISKGTDSNGKSVCSVMILGKAYVNKPVKIETENRCESQLKLYIVQEEGIDFNYNFENILGDTKLYANIQVLPSGKIYKNDTRVYEVKIDVKKGDILIETVTAYKSVVE